MPEPPENVQPMKDDWLAVDVRTSPRVRASRLRERWEQMVADPQAGDSRDRYRGVREPIAASWRRSILAGVDPSARAAPIEADPSGARERWNEHPLAAAAPRLLEELGPAAEHAGHLIAITDAEGLLLWVEGASALREHAAENINLREGSRWSERVAGTNALGTALAENHAVQVFASEHFAEGGHSWSCAAAPVIDPVSGRTLGAVDLTGPIESAHPYSLVLAMTAAKTLEVELARRGSGDGVATRKRARPRSAPRAEPLEFAALGRDRLAVKDGTRSVSLSKRHSEILVLLAEDPGGLTAEELAVALHGDLAKPVTARAEMSRLRRLLGGQIETAPYRLVTPPRSDVTDLKRLLEDGRVREAAELHSGVLLPGSEAPGVVELRDELEGWTRHAVMTADDAEALWAWVSSPPGQGDLPAWVRFLSTVPYEDGRRALAAARVAGLRRRYASAA
jgi:hypothetical protein